MTTGRQLSGLSQDPVDLATIVAGIDVMDYTFVNLVESGSSQSLVREVSQDMCIRLLEDTRGIHIGAELGRYVLVKGRHATVSLARFALCEN